MNNIVSLHDYSPFNGVWLTDDGLFEREIDIHAANGVIDIIIRDLYDTDVIVENPDERLDIEFISASKTELVFVTSYKSISRKVYHKCNVCKYNHLLMDIETKYSDTSTIDNLFMRKIENRIDIKCQPIDDDFWSQYDLKIKNNAISITGFEIFSKENYIIDDVIFHENILCFKSHVISDGRRGIHKFYFDSNFKILSMDYSFIEFSQAIKLTDVAPTPRSFSPQEQPASHDE